MVVDVGRVVPGDGNVRAELIEQGGSDVRQFIQNEGTPANSAKVARRPVPADGSRTRSAGVIAAAVAAANPSAIGVENR